MTDAQEDGYPIPMGLPMNEHRIWITGHDYETVVIWLKDNGIDYGGSYSIPLRRGTFHFPSREDATKCLLMFDGVASPSLWVAEDLARLMRKP